MSCEDIAIAGDMNSEVSFSSSVSIFELTKLPLLSQHHLKADLQLRHHLQHKI